MSPAVEHLSEKRAQAIMGEHFLGSQEGVKAWSEWYDGEWTVPVLGELPPIPYSTALLAEHCKTRLLVLRLPHMADRRPFTIRNLRERLGVRADGRPCFSRIGLPSDRGTPWALRPCRIGWFLIAKEIITGETVFENRSSSFAECDTLLKAWRHEMPYAADVVYTGAFWELLHPPHPGEPQPRMLRHTCTWCADEINGLHLRVGYNQPRDGFHFEAYPPHEWKEDHGVLAIVPPDLDSSFRLAAP